MTTTRITLWTTMAWIAIIPLAIANGLLRQFVLSPFLGVGLAQPLSGFLLILAIAGVAWLLVRRVKALGQKVWLVIGCAWGVATLGFEYLMLTMSGKGFDDLVSQYNFTDYNIWPLVHLWTIVAPISLRAISKSKNADKPAGQTLPLPAQQEHGSQV